LIAILHGDTSDNYGKITAVAKIPPRNSDFLSLSKERARERFNIPT
jgi:hypothetical protein